MEFIDINSYYNYVDVYIGAEKTCRGVSPAPGLSVMSLSSRPLLWLVCAGRKVRLSIDMLTLSLLAS